MQMATDQMAVPATKWGRQVLSSLWGNKSCVLL